MHQQLEEVREFMVKHGYPAGARPGQWPSIDLLRVHLIAEELGELSIALANRDLVGVADALTDLAYVVLGAAVTYGIPLDEVWAEVHKSNMTKAVRGPQDTRLRDKGNSYVPPNVRGVLEVAGLISPQR